MTMTMTMATKVGDDDEKTRSVCPVEDRRKGDVVERGEKRRDRRRWVRTGRDEVDDDDDGNSDSGSTGELVSEWTFGPKRQSEAVGMVVVGIRFPRWRGTGEEKCEGLGQDRGPGRAAVGLGPLTGRFLRVCVRVCACGRWQENRWPVEAGRRVRSASFDRENARREKTGAKNKGGG
jgi:hypothetical protein